MGDAAPVHSDGILRAAISEYVDLSLLSQISETSSLLSALATSLALHDPTPAAIVSAVSDLLLEQRGTKEQRRIEQVKIDELKALLQDATDTHQELSRSTRLLEDKFEAQKPTLIERQSQLKYLDGKSKEYAIQLQALKESVQSSGLSSAIYHSELKQLHSKLMVLEDEVNSKQNQLSAFKSLPPVRRHMLCLISPLAKLILGCCTGKAQDCGDQSAVASSGR